MQRATRIPRAPRDAMKDGRQMSNYARRALLQVLIDFIIIASFTATPLALSPPRGGKSFPSRSFHVARWTFYVTL